MIEAEKKDEAPDEKDKKTPDKPAAEKPGVTR